jgi:hypothetical protein
VRGRPEHLTATALRHGLRSDLSVEDAGAALPRLAQGDRRITEHGIARIERGPAQRAGAVLRYARPALGLALAMTPDLVTQTRRPTDPTTQSFASAWRHATSRGRRRRPGSLSWRDLRAWLPAWRGGRMAERRTEMRRHEERAIRAEAAELVCEAEAIVQGRLLVDRWSVQPGLYWMALNTLAHAEWHFLTQIADGEPINGGTIWDGALRLLASEVLAAAGSSERLIGVQRAILVPLELRVLGASTTPTGAAELVRVVLAELAQTHGRTERGMS